MSDSRINKYTRKSFQYFHKPLIRYIIRRILNSLFTLFLIITAVFLLLRVTPKEKYLEYDKMIKMNPSTKANYIQKTYEKYGLNEPVLVQLAKYYKNILPIPKDVCVNTKYTPDYSSVECTKYKRVYTNFGESTVYKRGKPVMDLIKERFPVSFKLSIWALLATYLFAYPLGVYMAKNKGRLIDKLGNAYIIAIIAVPGLIYYYLWNLFGMRIGLPSIFDRNNILSWIIPIWAIAFTGIGGTAMWVRRFMVDEMNSDYVKFARSKGLTEDKIMFKHVLRNAIVPLIRNVPAAFLFTVIGSYFVEILWVIPGSGQLLIESLKNFDNPLAQGLVIIYAALSMLALLLGDIITVFFDPRISLTTNK